MHMIGIYRWLTVDGYVKRLADVITDKVGHIASPWTLVIAGHIDYGESGASITKLDIVTGCDLRAAFQPMVGGGGARGGGAGQTDRAVELHYIWGTGFNYNIGDSICGLKQ